MPSTPASPTPTPLPAEPAARGKRKTGGAAAAPDAQRRLRSDDLFAGSDEVRIEHAGAVYRLRITSLGKLILTK